MYAKWYDDVACEFFIFCNYIMKKTTNTTLKTFIFVFLTCWMIIVLFRLFVIMDRQKNYCPNDKVCIDKDRYVEMTSQPTQTVVVEPSSIVTPSYTRERDMRVLNDPLYPAFNRTDRGTFETVVDNTLKRNINIPTQYYNDSYRLVGYVSNPDDDTGRYKLFARQKDRNRADFYMIPVNKNYEMKIQITDKMTVGDKLRDVDTLPEVMTFNSPLLSPTPYTFVELPKGDLTDEIF